MVFVGMSDKEDKSEDKSPSDSFVDIMLQKYKEAKSLRERKEVTVIVSLAFHAKLISFSQMMRFKKNM